LLEGEIRYLFATCMGKGYNQERKERKLLEGEIG
jgi:hypothetical protein